MNEPDLTIKPEGRERALVWIGALKMLWAEQAEEKKAKKVAQSEGQMAAELALKIDLLKMQEQANKAVG